MASSDGLCISIALVLKRVVAVIERANLRAPSEESVRATIKSIKDATTDYRSKFANTTGKKICCVRIPVKAFGEDAIEQLDSGTIYFRPRDQISSKHRYS